MYLILLMFVLLFASFQLKEWIAIPFSKGSSQPRVKPWSPILQADSLPSEPPGKPQSDSLQPHGWTGRPGVLRFMGSQSVLHD